MALKLFLSFLRRLKKPVLYLCAFLCFSAILTLPIFGASVILALLQRAIGAEEPIAPLRTWAIASGCFAGVGVLGELGTLSIRLSDNECLQARDGDEEGSYVRMWQMSAKAVLEALFLRRRLTASVPSSQASNSNVV
ncbi:hypothetical protein B0O99DRAFT_692999 [Bisporella sp. PMI_857]|nr:hypothetical protein B0O99DRAFT_692999 [Bisporella sp. PMI_857]